MKVLKSTGMSKNREKEISELAKKMNCKVEPVGYAFLNTTVAEVLFRGGHGMLDHQVKPVYSQDVVLALLQLLSYHELPPKEFNILSSFQGVQE